MKKDLLTLLAELSSNVSEEDRERIRAEIQQLYRLSDSRLDSLVRSHRENLSRGLQSCSRIINSVSESRRRCQALKERISGCMETLQVNRDNIRRMWLESLQRKYAHRMLGEIEELRKIPRTVGDSLADKKLEHATDVIVSSVKLLDRTQCNADALKELKLEVYNMQEKLYLMLLEDLRKHVHLAGFLDRFGECSGDVTYEDVFSYKIPKSDFYFKDVLGQVTFDRPYVQVLLKCVATMRRLPETMNFLKDCCQEDLESMACQASKFMHDVIQNSAEVPVLEMHPQKQRIFFIDLVESVFCVFAKVAQQYKSLAEVYASVEEPSGEAGVGFHLADVYSKIQAAVERFLGHYFERPASVVPSARESLAFGGAHNAADVSAYFSPEHFAEDQSSNLFKFANSFHSIASKKYSRGSRVLSGEFSGQNAEKAEEATLLCKPALHNVTVVFKALKSFISEMEQVFDVEGIDSTPLYNFLCDSTNLFLDQVNSDVTKTLKSVSANLEAWNTTGDHPGSRWGSEKQALVCSSLLDGVLEELEGLLSRLPDYSGHFLRLTYFVLLDYKDMCGRAFKQMFPEEHNFLSVSWAKDPDIRRFMKSFLNWRHLEDDDQTRDVIAESPDEVRLRNQQESRLLVRNLRYEGGLSWLVIADLDKLANLALLQENLLWFSHRLQGLAKAFARHEGVDVSCLKKLIREFEDFADVCLLALHLEVRARCFHRLLPLTSPSAEGDFPHLLDSAVKGLTGDLLKIDEVLLPILSTKEFKYVFEGLGELAASLVITITSGLTKLSDTAVLRLDRSVGTIQCCLSSITASREAALERARAFVDLLKSTPEDVVDVVVEEGPIFEEREYESVLRLLTSGEPEGSHVGDYYQEKLRSIFGRLADGGKPEGAEALSA